MSPDQFNSTDKRPVDPYPETPRRISNGIVDFAVTDFNLVSGRWVATKAVDLTDLIDLGNRVKGFPPKCLKAEVWVLQTTSYGGETRDYMRPLPYNGDIRKSSIAFGNIDIKHYIQNLYLVVENAHSSTLYITASLDYDPDTTSFVPGWNLSCSYKIESTIYDFTNAL